MDEENLYGMSDEKVKEVENLILQAENSSENSEDFINKVFPNLSSEDKLKIAMFSSVFVENFCLDEESDENYEESEIDLEYEEFDEDDSEEEIQEEQENLEEESFSEKNF